MNAARSSLSILILIVLLLSACAPKAPAPTASPTPTIPPVKGGGSQCGAPGGSILQSPAMGAVVNDLTPALKWGYVDPACPPDGYNVRLRTGPYFEDDLGDTTSSNSWTPPADLKPGTEYSWGVQAVADLVTGPYSGDFSFFTGPMCTIDQLKAPIPLIPMNGWTLSDLQEFSLKWDYPDPCLPDSYEIQVTSNLDFDGSPLNGSTSSPATHWAPASLADCTRYFWRVRAVSGDTSGPFSVVHSFKVEISGSCPAEANGIIQGTVWEDMCAGWGGNPASLPLGCAMDGDQLTTNHTYDPGEPGIPGLVVSLGEGACPASTILRDIPTGSDGVYDFFMVSPGTYCVSMDAGTEWNNPTLLPGAWTYPVATKGMQVNQTVTVSAGEVTENVDFGWWYRYGLGWGSTNASLFGLVWDDQCIYDQADPVPDPLPQGCVNDEYGVHADKIHQLAEPGIPGVQVDIGVGDCPSSGLSVAVTDNTGYYQFPKLAPGKYCLRIDPAHGSPNAAILLPGQWTVIPSGHEGMTFRPVTLSGGHTTPGQDFGWDYDDSPAQVQEPYITLGITALCRHGPGAGYSASGNAAEGQSYHIEAVSLDEGWYKIRFNDTVRCWVGAATGLVTGNILNIPRLFIPTPTPIQSRYCAQFSQRMCIAHISDGCYWDASANPPYCAGP